MRDLFGRENYEYYARLTGRILKVEDEWITVDGNHELAGENLKFELQIVDIREATVEELEHGHAHSGAGCSD